ncbi:hypothetical protein LFM09_44400 [Lentzea alba]|uniref:hypothetical protein n=1 Tax=Lentzea alba TaxID=2714351 RepID=UPI0039BF4880
MSFSSDFHSLRNVQEWLKRMRDECVSVAFAHAKATAPAWTGAASTAFDEYRHRARMRWLDVSDAFDSAHAAVKTYLYTHDEVRGLLQHGDGTQADRFWQQLADEERIAVRAVDRAAEELRQVRSELPERAVAAVPRRRPVADFMTLPHHESLLTTPLIAARYPHWQRHG